jgi:hypothetical protein
MLTQRECNGVRGSVALGLLVAILPALGIAATTLQSDMDGVLRADPRNAGIAVSLHTRDGGSKLVYDLTSVAPTNSVADVFRVFLQFASREKDREFNSVELGFRGASRFLIRGDYFKQLGQEFGTQNPIYTIRTFPEHLTKLDGSPAYPTWTGGLLGVSGKQMEDFNDFHRQWWLDASVAGLGGQIAVKSTPALVQMPPIPPTSARESSIEVSAKAAPSTRAVPSPEESPSPIESRVPMQVPAWLKTFPGAMGRVDTSIVGAVESSYTAPSSPEEVVKFYDDQLSKGGAVMHIAFDGIGTTIQASRDRESCVIRVAEATPGTTVSEKCAIENSSPSRPDSQAAMPLLPPGAHLVEYSITGSAAAVALTYRNASGGTEQNVVGLPSSMSFYSLAGRFVYLSAQNKTSGGDVHVSITVDGRILQQATSASAYGIATASGSVPR